MGSKSRRATVEVGCCRPYVLLVCIMFIALGTHNKVTRYGLAGTWELWEGGIFGVKVKVIDGKQVSESRC